MYRFTELYEPPSAIELSIASSALTRGAIASQMSTENSAFVGTSAFTHESMPISANLCGGAVLSI
jgi:hypothetical protein